MYLFINIYWQNEEHDIVLHDAILIISNLMAVWDKNEPGDYLFFLSLLLNIELLVIAL